MSATEAAAVRLVLCADDFGQSAAIDRGILRLARSGRLGAVSCLVGGPAWQADATPLLAARRQRPISQPLRLGLHLNLTQGVPVSAELALAWPLLPPLTRLIRDAHLRRLPMGAIDAEIEAQFDAFEGRTGLTPDYVDGHQHIHHLPGIRELLLWRLEQRPAVRVRSTGRMLGPGHALKRWIIERTGGRALGELLQVRDMSANTALLGVYDFAEADYRRLMRGWLSALPDHGAWLFCHPGDAVAPSDGGARKDPIAEARIRELAYLDSDAFAEDLVRHGAEAGILQ